jgi:hypothetical protein
MYALPRGKSVCGKNLPFRLPKHLLMLESCATLLHYLNKVESAYLKPSCLQYHCHLCHLCLNNPSISFSDWWKIWLQKRAMTTLRISCGRMRNSFRKCSTTGHPGSGPFTRQSLPNPLKPSSSHRGKSIMAPKW